MKKWYAVLMDEEDNDWGHGSKDYEEAVAMAKKCNAYAIAVINDGTDPVCEKIILSEDF